MSVRKLPAEILAHTVDDETQEEAGMGYREAREVARIRAELRERLMSDQHEGAGEVLARLRYLAEDHALTASAELRHEYERWRARFAILAASARNN